MPFILPVLCSSTILISLIGLVNNTHTLMHTQYHQQFMRLSYVEITILYILYTFFFQILILFVDLVNKISRRISHLWYMHICGHMIQGNQGECCPWAQGENQESFLCVHLKVSKVVSKRVFFIFFNFYLFIYLFLAVLGFCFCARAFSSCGTHTSIALIKYIHILKVLDKC